MSDEPNEPRTEPLPKQRLERVSKTLYQLRDWTGIIAILISLTTFALTTNSAAVQARYATRRELTDTLDRINALQINYAQQARATSSDLAERAYLIALSGSYNQQYNTLLERAMSLADSIDEFELVTWSDYVNIAQTNTLLGEYLLAEEYYQKAIATAQTLRHHVVIRRSYAAFLFESHRIDEGREIFRQAIDLAGQMTDQGQDFVHNTNGQTYQSWAGFEAGKGGMTEAESLVGLACDEFSALSNQVLRETLLQSLLSSWQQLQLQVGLPASSSELCL